MKLPDLRPVAAALCVLLPGSEVRIGKRALLIVFTPVRVALTRAEAEDLTRWLTGAEPRRVACGRLAEAAKTYHLDQEF